MKIIMDSRGSARANWDVQMIGTTTLAKGDAKDLRRFFRKGDSRRYPGEGNRLARRTAAAKSRKGGGE